MSQEAYQLLARAMRYVFILIAALFFLLTVVWMRRDQRQWNKEKKQLPDAGTVGELVDADSLRRYPVPREGTLGSSRRCDIRIIGRGVRRRHADVRFREGKGLMIIPSGGGRITLNGRTVTSPVCAGRGARLRIGSVLLTLKLFEGLDVPAEGVYADEEYDPLMAVVPDADGWSQVIPLPEDRIDGGEAAEEIPGPGEGFDAGIPFDGLPMAPGGENGGGKGDSDETER